MSKKKRKSVENFRFADGDVAADQVLAPEVVETVEPEAPAAAPPVEAPAADPPVDSSEPAQVANEPAVEGAAESAPNVEPQTIVDGDGRAAAGSAPAEAVSPEDAPPQAQTAGERADEIGDSTESSDSGRSADGPSSESELPRGDLAGDAPAGGGDLKFLDAIDEELQSQPTDWSQLDVGELSEVTSGDEAEVLPAGDESPSRAGGREPFDVAEDDKVMPAWGNGNLGWLWSALRSFGGARRRNT